MNDIFNIDDLPPQLQFIYLAMTKSAIYFKEIGKNKEFFIEFSKEIWNSMEFSDLKELKETLKNRMNKDIQENLELYIKNMKK